MWFIAPRKAYLGVSDCLKKPIIKGLGLEYAMNMLTKKRTARNYLNIRRTLAGAGFACLPLVLLFPPSVFEINGRPSVLFAQSNRSDVKRFRALRDKAVDLARAGKVENSLPYFRKMVELQPYNESALYLLALALLHRREAPPHQYRRGLRKAVQLLTTCVAMQKRYSERSRALGLRLFYLGLAYWYSGDAVRALTAFRGSYRADFERLDAVYNEYAVLEELGQKGEARLVRGRYLKLLKTTDVDD